MAAMAAKTPAGSAAPEEARLETFRRLAYLVAFATFLLIVVGGVVRVSDSGLGCGPAGGGTEGWPLCGGGLIPGIDSKAIIEYTHRILAAGVTVAIAIMALIAWRALRDRGQLRRLTLAALGLIVVQAVLGGLTVEKGLKQELVAAHLGVAMVQIGLLLLIARLARQAASDQHVQAVVAPKPIRVVASIALVVMLGTIVAGGYMSATDLSGTTPEQANSTALHAHRACGEEFPTCNGAFLPFGETRAADIHLIHRSFMYLASGLIVALFAMVMLRRRELEPTLSRNLTRRVAALLGLLVGQVLLGALNVWVGEYEWLIVAHLAVATLLWSLLVVFALEAFGVRISAPTGVRDDSRTQVLPA